MKKSTIAWSASNMTGAVYLGPIEFRSTDGEWQCFEVMATPEKLIFGTACNVGFLESGYILRDETESLDESLSELLADLEELCNDGNPSRIVYNDRV